MLSTTGSAARKQFRQLRNPVVVLTPGFGHAPTTIRDAPSFAGGSLPPGIRRAKS